MTSRTQQIRNVAFYVLLASVVALFAAPALLKGGPIFLAAVNAAFCGISLAGVVIVWQTLRLKEGIFQKLSFLLAGGAAVGLPLSFVVALLLDRLVTAQGHPRPFGPDGFAELYALGIFPIALVIGAVGAIVCLIKGKIAERKAAAA